MFVFDILQFLVGESNNGRNAPNYIPQGYGPTTIIVKHNMLPCSARILASPSTHWVVTGGVAWSLSPTQLCGYAHSDNLLTHGSISHVHTSSRFPPTERKNKFSHCEEAPLPSINLCLRNQWLQTANYTRTAKIFQKSMSHLNILRARRVTWRMFHTEGPQILGTTVQKLISLVNWPQGFLRSWIKPQFLNLRDSSFSPTRPDRLWGPTRLPSNSYRTPFIKRWKVWGATLSTNFHLPPRLWICGAALPIPHIPTWRCAECSTTMTLLLPAS
jgi:hypothetical protein